MSKIGKFKFSKLETREKMFESIAYGLKSKSKRWEYLFTLASLEGVKDWKLVSMIYHPSTGTRIGQEDFTFARLAKLVSTTEEWKVNEDMITKHDLVSWNRQAILAMIEAEKQNSFDIDSITRGYKTIELINLLYPDYLLNR